MKENIILEITLEFALEIVVYCEILEQSKRFVISQQLLKSGTSIGANVREAQSPESRADFIHKMKVAAKEASETEYWLILCQQSSNYPNCEPLLQKVTIIQKILSKIIGSSKSGG